MTSLPLTARTALFTPANRPDRIDKALAGSAQIVIADLEDAVPEPEKDQARQQLADLLAGAGKDQLARLVVRVNSPHTEAGEKDLVMLSSVAQDPAGIMIPKAEDNGVLDAIPAPLDKIPVIALIETAAAVLQVQRIAQHDIVKRLAVGAIDLSTELHCDVNSLPIHMARAATVLASSAAGLTAPLDSPNPDFRNPEVISNGAKSAVSEGFGGMLCIHPMQLEHVIRAFTPEPELVGWARRVVEVGTGAGSVDGEMVDRPVILRAQQILADTKSTTNG